ncbi:MAG: hypothetical protein II564_05770 [Oscillospiraceae bacterium]|jgi:hypothetical protein|nr:hypothetical protein [Oscillospiraceae bacterium]MBQ5870537.1 hypothetical protein [Lachnospiraceae bacterium]
MAAEWDRISRSTEEAMNLKTIDVKYYPPHSQLFSYEAFHHMKQFYEEDLWSSDGNAGYGDLMDITMDDFCGTAIITAEISMLEFDEQIETLGEMMTTVLPHGSDSAMFLIGLPKFVWLDEEAFPFISHVAVGEKVTGFFERRQEQEREDTVRIVCIATLKEEELAESMEPLNSIPRILPMERDLNRPPMESWSASPHAHITEFEGSWAERRMDRNRRGSWRIRS